MWSYIELFCKFAYIIPFVYNLLIEKKIKSISQISHKINYL